MSSVVDRYVIARESNIVQVDFNREPDPPAPCFPGANGRRLDCEVAWNYGAAKAAEMGAYIISLQRD